MKIALVTEHLGALSAAGTDAYPVDPALRVLPLARALAGQGQQVTVYSRQDSAARADSAAETSLCPGVAISRVPAGPAQRLPADVLLEHLAALAGQLADRWRRDPPDVIHAHYWTSGLAALAGARDLGVPVVQTFQSLGGGVRPGRVLAAAGAAARVRLEAAIGRSARAVMASSPDERAALARLGVPHSSIRIVPCGVDIARFRPSGPAAERGRRPRLLMVAPPGDRQGPLTMLRALADVPEAELVIAGGAAGDPGYQALARLARRLGVQGRLTCLGKPSEADMPPLMRSADMLVHLTPVQRFAMVPVEAMACGIPVVVSEDAAPGDAVIDGNTGFLVPPAEPRKLTGRIRQLLDSPLLREGYGIAAASRVRSRYSWERIGQETLAVYEALLAPRMEAAA
jgi:glycosyltransferase involved in cell wall biosynthesis